MGLISGTTIRRVGAMTQPGERSYQPKGSERYENSRKEQDA